MASIKKREKPPFVQGPFFSKGRIYCYFRKPGCARVRLPGLPYSPEFMAAYTAALAASAPRKDIGASRIAQGTVAACVGFDSFRENFSEETWRTYLTYWNLFRADHGDKRVKLLKRHDLLRHVASNTLS